jgi:hypothetical protein
MNRPCPDVHTERQTFVTMVWKQQQDTSSLEERERKVTTCKIDLTVTATRSYNNRDYYEILRPQKEVPWMMKLKIDTSCILPAAVSSNPQSQCLLLYPPTHSASNLDLYHPTGNSLLQLFQCAFCLTTTS